MSVKSVTTPGLKVQRPSSFLVQMVIRYNFRLMQTEHITGKRPRVGINAHLLSGEAGYRRAGIHQYIYQVLRHLPYTENGPDYLVFTNQPDVTAGKMGMTAVSTRLNTNSRLLRILWEQLIWPLQARQRRVDLLHSMAFVTPLLSRRTAVVTIYDLSFMHYPEQFPAGQRRYLTTMTRQACRRARRIITISQSSRQDVHHFFHVPLDRIDVVLPGVDDAYRPLPEEAVSAFCREKGLERFILHVGTLQPRKNIPVLLNAFANLPPSGLKLALVGGKGWLYNEIFTQVKKLKLEERVLFTGYVPDGELPLWYNAAELLVFPSVYEGFGMPVVEAMACGTPVIASDSSSIPEAVGRAGLLFNPQNAAELTDRITAVQQDPALRAKLKEWGLQHARNFSWERAGRETAVAYRRALQGR